MKQKALQSTPLSDYSDKDTKLLDMYNKNWNEASSSFQALIGEIREDYEFYLGDQWDDSVQAELEKSGSPVLNLNYIKKQVDVVSGAQRQNRADIKVYPIEGADEEIAEVLTRTIKWVRSDKSSEFTESRAFKDALICGIGWLNPRMDYALDPLNGDVIIDKCSPFDIFPDPHFTKPDLSDCDYILRHKKVNREKCKALWPKKSEEIEGVIGKNVNNDLQANPNISNDKGNSLKVVECWYREWSDEKIIVDTKDPANTEVWDAGAVEDAKKQLSEHLPGRKEEIDAADKSRMLEIVLQTNPDFVVMKQRVCRIKLLTVIEDTIIVYDGINPDGMDEFPFIPVFAYYEDSYSEWDLKIQGVVRNLKDPQREKNKRRSQIMRAINSMPSSGWMVEEGSISDINSYINGAGPGRIMYFNAGRSVPQRLPSPELPVSLMTLEQMSDQDMLRQGPNADLLGMMGESGAPGVTIQLRQKQGMVSLQEMFDNLSMSMRTLGRILVKLIVQKFDTNKIRRILGTDCPYYQTESDKKDFNDQVAQLQSQISQATEEIKSINMRQIEKGVQANPQEIEQAQKGTEGFTQKLQGILLQEDLRREQESRFWEKYEAMSKTARFDTHVDEMVNSPTARIAGLLLLTQFQQAGGQIDPMVMLELSDVPKIQKDKIRKLDDERKQMQQQQAQIEMQKTEQYSQELVFKNQQEIASIQQRTALQQQLHQQEMAKTQLAMQKTYLEMLKLKSEMPPGFMPEIKTPDELGKEFGSLNSSQAAPAGQPAEMPAEQQVAPEIPENQNIS